jgi:hypothetical protein
MVPEHETGTVPKGETHYLCLPRESGVDGWWATESAFRQVAVPVGPGAEEYVGETFE